MNHYRRVVYGCLISIVVLSSCLWLAAQKSKKHAKFGPTHIHIVVQNCQAQEPMVHADVGGTVSFHSDADVTLTMNPKGVLEEDDAQAGTIDVKANAEKKVKVLATSPAMTQFQIDTCKAPWTRPRTGDPNEILIP